MFTEMRTAALLQKALHGPEVLPAQRVLRMATIDGARALGLESEIGSLEVGKKADLALIGLQELHSTPKAEDVVSTVVYSAGPGDVKTVIVDGRILMKDRELLTLDESVVIENANTETAQLFDRAGLEKGLA
jgi:5-methylthioadenosine/S-adenosylhomocysteine deaminase